MRRLRCVPTGFGGASLTEALDFIFGRILDSSENYKVRERHRCAAGAYIHGNPNCRVGNTPASARGLLLDFEVAQKQRTQRVEIGCFQSEGR